MKTKMVIISKSTGNCIKEAKFHCAHVCLMIYIWLTFEFVISVSLAKILTNLQSTHNLPNWKELLETCFLL